MNTISKCAFCYSFKQQFFQHPGIRRDFPYIGNSKTSFVLKHILVCWSGILPHLVHFTMEMKEKENKCFERSWRKHVQLQSTRTLFQRKQKTQQIKVRQNYVGTPQDGLVLAVQKCLQTAQYSYIGELVTDWLLRTFEKHLLGANKSTNIAHKTNQYPKYDSDPSNKSDMGPDHTLQGAAFFRCLLRCNSMETKLQTLMDLLILWDYIWLQKNIKKIWIQSVIIVDVRGPRIFSTVVAGLPVVRGFLTCKMHFDHVLMKLWRNRWNEIMEKICETKQWKTRQQ